MTRTVRDAALLLDVMAGPDERDRPRCPPARTGTSWRAKRGVAASASPGPPTSGRRARGSRGGCAALPAGCLLLLKLLQRSDPSLPRHAHVAGPQGTLPNLSSPPRPRRGLGGRLRGRWRGGDGPLVRRAAPLRRRAGYLARQEPLSRFRPPARAVDLTCSASSRASISCSRRRWRSTPSCAAGPFPKTQSRASPSFAARLDALRRFRGT